MKSLFFSFFVLLFIGVQAQEILPVPRNVQKTFKNKTRSTTGAPGVNYWQNSAQYKININFDPTSRLISGEERIVYYNDSPDTLTNILFKLYPNLYKKGAPRSSTIRPEDVTDGVKFSKFDVNGTEQDLSVLGVNGTNLNLSVEPLAPGDSISFVIDWDYTLNKGSHIRTGQVDEGAFFVAYFFPRITVYDDIDGWNRFGYNGNQEFYNDFSDFDVKITVPGDYAVWATGDLKNPESVLNRKIIKRLKKAAQSDEVIDVITPKDLHQKTVTHNRDSETWEFEAKDVTDFVFALSNHYVWQSSSLVVDPKTKRRTRVDAVYNPKHKDYKEVIDFARKTVKAMSYTLPAWPFPYPHETVFDGLGQMEYPMMVNDNPLESRASTIELTDHEIMHTMFPFYMGTNETKYAFMDEGWATLGEWIISPLIDSTLADPYGMMPYDQAAGTDGDLPIMVPSTQQSGMAYYLNSYPKPAMGYLYVRDMLGAEGFNKALHHYIEQWHGKHPMPLDFFNSMNEGAKKNMNWFWKKWFYEPGYPDLAIADVKKRKTGYEITVKSIGNKPVPVDLDLEFVDGTHLKAHRSIAVWEKSDHVKIDLTTHKELKKVKLGSLYNADVNFDNNSYFMK